MYKMMIPNNSSSNCFDCILYSVLMYYKFDYELYNIKYFYTNYYSDKYPYIDRYTSKSKILNEFFGIDIVFHNDIANLRYFVDDLLKNGPIGIYIDPYYCKWSPFYKTTHYTHVFLIVGIEQQDRKFICFDVYYPKEGYIKMGIDELISISKEYFVFQMNARPPISIELIVSHISKTVNEYDGNINEKKDRLFNYLTEDIDKLLFSNKLETSVSLINLMWIAEDKKHFPIAFRFLENMLQQSIFSQIYELASHSEKSFTQLRMMLIKYAKTKILSKTNIRNIVNRIYDIDAIMIEYVDKIIRTKCL